MRKSVNELRQLLGINPTNIWDATRKPWQLNNQRWKQLIQQAGLLAGIENPEYATRENCWQQNGGLAAVITGKAVNGGASVLDSYVIELLLHLFMPRMGQCVYNPFGGGVQTGFVSGFFGYDYEASEIRVNQCVANNAICAAFDLSAKWHAVDSQHYHGPGADLVFTCPPYYGVETYLDADGKPPQNEANAALSYQEYWAILEAGLTRAWQYLKPNRFFVVMIGDGRNPSGSYYGIEGHMEAWILSRGMHLYNKIIYLEVPFTRAMMTPKTLRTRKLPKCNQTILVAYKGNPNNIPQLFEDLALTS